jgi:hypothetical protein
MLHHETMCTHIRGARPRGKMGACLSGRQSQGSRHRRRTTWRHGSSALGEVECHVAAREPDSQRGEVLEKVCKCLTRSSGGSILEHTKGTWCRGCGQQFY